MHAITVVVLDIFLEIVRMVMLSRVADVTIEEVADHVVWEMDVSVRQSMMSRKMMGSPIMYLNFNHFPSTHFM